MEQLINTSLSKLHIQLYFSSAETEERTLKIHLSEASKHIPAHFGRELLVKSNYYYDLWLRRTLVQRSQRAG